MHGNTFANLPPLSTVETRLQVSHIITKGWVPILEYKDDEFWHLWPLPHARTPEMGWVMEQVEICKNQNPEAVVRLSGYCPKKQMVELRLVVQNGF